MQKLFADSVGASPPHMLINCHAKLRSTGVGEENRRNFLEMSNTLPACKCTIHLKRQGPSVGVHILSTFKPRTLAGTMMLYAIKANAGVLCSRQPSWRNGLCSCCIGSLLPVKSTVVVAVVVGGTRAALQCSSGHHMH